MKRIFFAVGIIIVLALSACDKLTNQLSDYQDFEPSQMFSPKKETMKVLGLDFSDDYKTFTLSADLIQDIGPYELSDPSEVRTEVHETLDGIRLAKLSTPELVKISNVEAENIHDNDVRMLLLVDLSLPQNDLDRIRASVKEMKSAFKYNNLFVAFMDSTSVSATMKVTDYVLENYFTKAPCNHVRLYRSILTKSNEIKHGDNYWEDAEKRVLITFSNGIVYNDATNRPIDPDHYRLQEQLVAADTTTADSSFHAYYVSIDCPENSCNENEESVIQLFCNNNGGTVVKNFHWESFKNEMYRNLYLSFPDYELLFENPDYKVYRGDNTQLTVNFYNAANDSLVASLTTEAAIGEPFNPIIVHGHSIEYVILQGLFLGIMIILVLWLVFQFIVPFIRHRVFLHKYVIPYTGPNMSFAGKTVGDTCYLCKAPFEEGERIVVRCEHTMHKSCWDENGYHCPEYSDRCKHGSHYYNTARIFDRRNAPFYLRWLLVAIVAALLAWICFSVHIELGFYSRFYRFAHSSVTQPPFFGFLIGFFLTFGISILTIHPGKDFRAICRIFLRSLLVAVGCWLSFQLVNLVIYLFDIRNLAFLLNWIPWTVSGFIIAYSSSLGFLSIGSKSATRLRGGKKHSNLMLLVSILLGFISMYAWDFLFRYFELDFRVLLLLSFIIFSVGLVACIATVVPRSERYFLNVQGATKSMDIALFKWFRNCPGRIVTIGKSVDCSLQLTWDIQSQIAPIQAEIRLIKRMPYLIPIEAGVYVAGKSVRIGKKIRLHHGKAFTIGKTTFTYIEKDR